MKDGAGGAAERARAGDRAPARPACRPSHGGRQERGALLAYGALGLPLAFAALPIYVHVPRLYAEGLGLSLALVGAVLLAARIVDAVTDPLIGWANDRLPRRRLWIALALPALGAGMLGLLIPPAGAGAGWLFGLLVAVSLAYSVASIAYNAWGAEVAATPAARTRFVASREAFALAGVVLAAALPGLLGDAGWAGRLAPSVGRGRSAGRGAVGEAGASGEAGGGARPAAATAARRGSRASPGASCRCSWFSACGPCGGRPHRRRSRRLRAPLWLGLRAALADRGFARLLAVFAANGIAAAIPSADGALLRRRRTRCRGLRQAPSSHSTSSPLRPACRYGRDCRNVSASCAPGSSAWRWPWWCSPGQACSAAATWSPTPSSACSRASRWVPTSPCRPRCLRTCWRAGASRRVRCTTGLRLRPAVDATQGGGAQGPTCAVLEAGACFGWWSFVTKANLALAAGLALPLLALLGYTPGAHEAAAVGALAAVYGFVPVALKLVGHRLVVALAASARHRHGGSPLDGAESCRSDKSRHAPLWEAANACKPWLWRRSELESAWGAMNRETFLPDVRGPARALGVQQREYR